MATVVKVLNVKRMPGYLYFINTDGDVARVKKGSKNKSVVKKTTVKREKGYLYYLNKDGNIARSKMKRN